MIKKEYNRLINPFDRLPGLDAAPDFIPSPEYTDLLIRCKDAYKEMLTGDVLNFSKAELKTVLDKYEALFDESEKQAVYFEGMDEFLFLYDALISAYLFVEERGWDAHFALDDYSKFDMSEERNIINWLHAYEVLNKEIAFYLNYNTDCDCNNQQVYRVSYLGIHILKEDLAKIFEFSTLYGEHYCHLLQKYMNITWEEYYALTEEDELYYLRDNLKHYLSKKAVK
jgi:tRNA G10  N-methylase Trm11